MRLWYMTHAVVDRMEADPEFARFVHDAENAYKRTDFLPEKEGEPVSAKYARAFHPEDKIVITTNWDRSKTTISFPGEELDDEE